MHKTRLPWRFLAPLLLLNACTPLLAPSPLQSDEKVTISGEIRDLQGQPMLNQPMQLNLSLNKRQARSNAAGKYQFELLGKDTQLLAGLATLISVESHLDNQARVLQSFQALKSQVTLVPMQFWNSLKSPAADSTLANQRYQTFGWEAPGGNLRDYRVSLRNAQGETVWASTTTSTQQDLPSAALEPGQAYSWQVEADLGDYQASTEQRPLKTSQLPFKSLNVQKISVGTREYPAFHDSRFAFDLDDRLHFDNFPQLELEVRFASPISVQGLHWVGKGFSTGLEIRTAKGAAPLATRDSTTDYLLVEWPAVQTDVLYLNLTKQEGFVDIEELRFLTAS